MSSALLVIIVGISMGAILALYLIACVAIGRALKGSREAQENTYLAQWVQRSLEERP